MAGGILVRAQQTSSLFSGEVIALTERLSLLNERGLAAILRYRQYPLRKFFAARPANTRTIRGAVWRRNIGQRLVQPTDFEACV
jgi:hypothetical protein